MKTNHSPAVKQSYELARERYQAVGVDTEQALKKLAAIPISLHCWQGDDVGGFESTAASLGGGLVATGNYPGKARTPDELRADLEKTFSLIPGNHRLNLHAFYGEFGGKKVDRDEISTEHFKNWIAWAKSNGLGLDFNPTCFSHPKAADGFTLSHRDKTIREFWIEHCRLSRESGAAIGKALGKPCVTNVWIPDGDLGRRVRFLDRFFDLHVQGNMQPSVNHALRPEGSGDAYGAELGRKNLRIAYDWLEANLTEGGCRLRRRARAVLCRLGRRDRRCPAKTEALSRKAAGAPDRCPRG